MSEPSDPATRSLPPDATAPFDPAATRTAEPPSPAAPPDLPPNYIPLGEIGRGAMGVVYRVRQVLLNREVALKLILSGRHASPNQIARFLAEVQAAAAVDHPNVVRVYDSGEHAGTPYLAMEMVGGGTLTDKLMNGPLPPREAAELVAKVAEGVQAAHAAGIVHRDLKPGNILLTADGTPKVADFGLAKRPGASDLTHTGAILGTPGYMAPEQARGVTKTVGPPADVYALGAVLFHCLAGRPPFDGLDPIDVVLRAATDDPPSVTQFNRTVPRDLATIVAKCLRKAPAERYSNSGELAADLRRFLAGQPIHAQRAGWAERVWRKAGRWWAVVVGGVLLSLAVALIGVWWLNRRLQWDPAAERGYRRNDPNDLPKNVIPSIAGDPRDIAERFLNDAQLDPTNSAARKWTSQAFQFTWTSGVEPGVRDRPYYQFTNAAIDQQKILNDEVVELRGTATVLNRVITLGGGKASLRSGGKAKFTIRVRANKGVGAWRVDSFEFDDRGSRAGPAELPADATRTVIRETLNYPPEAFEKRTLGDYERLMGLQSWVFYFSGGPTQFVLALEETGQETIPKANLLASADRPYTSAEQEGRVCLQIGRRLGKDGVTPIDSVGMQLNANFGNGSGFPCLWYHWQGAEFKEVIGSADLSDGKEHELLALTAVEIDPPKGMDPRKVVLRMLAKKK